MFEIIAASSLVLLDFVFYEALDMIRRHAKIDYFQTGHHNLEITVKGTGMIANLLRSVVERFNFRKNITVNLSNESKSIYLINQLRNYVLPIRLNGVRTYS